MMLLDRRSLANASAKAEAAALLAQDVSALNEAAERRRKAPCQYDIYARSGRAADAVREHSFSSAPTRSGSVSLERPSLPFFVPLTPARWEAKRLAVASCGVRRVRGAVLTEPIWNRRQNLQHLEIVAQSCAVLWFRAAASRDARVCEGAGLRAYVREEKSGTTEPPIIIYVNQMDSGSGEVPAWFQPEPAMIDARRGHAFPPIANILFGRNAAAASDRPLRGLSRSRARETFGDFRSLGRVGLAGCSSSTRRARIGGKPPFFERADRAVGTSTLERGAQSLGNACFSQPDRLPSGKAARIALGGRGTPPCPHSKSRHPLGPSCARLSEFGSAFGLTIISACGTAPKNRREVDFCRRGRGKLRPGRNPATRPGRGGGDAAGKLRRMPCMGGGIDHVK